MSEFSVIYRRYFYIYNYIAYKQKRYNKFDSDNSMEWDENLNDLDKPFALKRKTSKRKPNEIINMEEVRLRLTNFKISNQKLIGLTSGNDCDMKLESGKHYLLLCTASFMKKLGPCLAKPDKLLIPPYYTSILTLAPFRYNL